MSGPANLFVPYMQPREFAKTVEQCTGLLLPDGCWDEHPLSENGAVWVEARAREGQELSWAAAISLAAGGFCMVWWEAPVVFYGGQRLNENPTLDFASCFAKSTGLENVPRQSTLCGDISTPPEPEPEPLPEIWTRTAFMFARAENAVAAAGLTTGWDWSGQLPPPVPAPLQPHLARPRRTRRGT